MAAADAQKRASNKYRLEHMATLGCKVKKEQAEAFKKYCASKGITANNALREYVMKCIDELAERGQ